MSASNQKSPFAASLKRRIDCVVDAETSMACCAALWLADIPPRTVV